jgi:hypothetical protein
MMRPRLYPLNAVSCLKIVILALLVLTVQGFPGAAPVAAQSEDLIVHEQSVEIDFPERISFRLSVDAPEPIERIELRYQPTFSEISRAERPDFEPGHSVDIDFDLDTRITYLPPGIDVQYRWIITLESGRQLETETEQFFYIDNRYDWQETSDGMVSIYYYDGGSPFGNTALDVTTRTLERFGSDFEVQLEEPINVVLYGSVADFQEALPYNSPEWIGGFADPGHNLIVAGIRPGDGAATEMGRMLTHEAVHLMVGQATQNPFNGAPRWLDEGLAITYQEVPEQRFQRILDLAVDEGRLIPVRALRSSFPTDPDLAIQSYAQSESIVEFLIEEHGHESISRILAAYREGVSHEQAVEMGLGMSLDELDAAWKEWLDYEGDRAEGPGTGGEPLTPDTLGRVEDVLTTVGIMPVLVAGGLIAIVLGFVKMIRAFSYRELDEDVDPDVEYYGQEFQHDPDLDSDPEDRFQP